MLEVLVFILLIILSPIALIAGLFSLFLFIILALALILTIGSIPINIVKQVIKCLKQEDQKNTQK